MNLILSVYESLTKLLFEPMTSLTDLLLSVSCFYFFFGIQKLNETKVGLEHWQKFFLFLGVSTLLGALAHAIFERLVNYADIGWHFNILCSISCLWSVV
jgi:hypothetical protein